MESTREDLIECVKCHTTIETIDRYQLINIYNAHLVTLLKKARVYVELIHGDSTFIINPSIEAVKILKSHKDYELYTFDELTFLKLAKFFIQKGFIMSYAHFMGDDDLIQFTANKRYDVFELYRSGLIMCNQYVKLYIQEFLNQI
jgi:hypothetical protein